MIIRDNFSYFSLKPYVVTPHLNRLNETVQMRGQNMFLFIINQVIHNYHQICPYLELCSWHCVAGYGKPFPFFQYYLYNAVRSSYTPKDLPCFSKVMQLLVFSISYINIEKDMSQA